MDTFFRQTVGHHSWEITIDKIDAILTKHLQPTDLEIYFGGGMYVESIHFSDIVPLKIREQVVIDCKRCAETVNFQFKEAQEKGGNSLSNRLNLECYQLCFDKRISLRDALRPLGFYPKTGSPLRKLKNPDQESAWDNDLQRFNVTFVIEAFAYRPKS